MCVTSASHVHLHQSSLCSESYSFVKAAVPILVSTKATGLTVNMIPSDTEEDNTEDEASTAPNTLPAQEAATVAKSPSPINP